MSYSNQQTSNLADLVSKLNTFLSGTPGWTSDHHDAGAGKWAMHKTGAGYDIYPSFRWDTVSPNHLGIYQALGFIGTGTDPGNHTDDSGNGEISGTDSVIDNGRNVPITNTPIQFWCFEDDHYAHIVVETVEGKYVHFGFGQFDKLGDWTGGEYVYGFKFYNLNSTSVGIRGSNSFLLDGLTKDNDPSGQNDREDFVATVHAEGLPNEGGSSKWAVHMGDQSSGSLGIDRATNARIHFVGGFRGGPIARGFGIFNANSEKALIPAYPLGSFYWDRTDDSARFMGFVKDIRGVNMRYFVGAQEVTVGSDTWVLFPSYFKQTNGGIGTTAWQGIAYKKVTT